MPPAPAGSLLFIGNDAAHGNELWVSDGTGAGTHRLTDACPGTCQRFSWKIPKIPFNPILGSNSGTTYFLVFPKSPAIDPAETVLWATDGTPQGTGPIAGHAAGLGFLGGHAYFGTLGLDGFTSGLLEADSTASSVRQVATLNTVAPGSRPVISPLDKGVLMLAYDGDRQRLWRSDGTPEGTVALAGFALDPSRSSLGSSFIRAGGLTFFAVIHEVGDDSRSEIWRTNGTDRGTRRVAALDKAHQVVTLTPWRGQLLFAVRGPQGCAFWASDGSVGGTREILPMPEGARCPSAVHALRQDFLFLAWVEKATDSGIRIFRSDGTPAGTRPLAKIPGFFADSSATQAGDALYFRTQTLTGRDSLVWRSDGTPAGTYRATRLPRPDNLFGFDGSLYFTASLTGPPGDVSRPRGLWRVSAKGGPRPVLLAPLDMSEFPTQFAPVGNRLFFAARDQTHGTELWVTDGTPQGTRLVLDIRPGLGSSELANFTAAGDKLFFTAEDGIHGRELWVSDGTAAGTHLAWDLNPGGFSSSPDSLVVAGERLFFSADDGESGPEPWALRLDSQ